MRLHLLVALILSLSSNNEASSSSCSPAYQKVLSLVGQEAAGNSVYSTPSTGSDTTCSLSATCCSSSAEAYLNNDTVARFQSMLFNNLNESITPCLNESLIELTADYVDQTKSVLLDGFRALSGANFNAYQNLFDNFYDYLKSGVRSLSLCNLDREFQKIYFTIYTTVFVETLKQQFRQVPTGKPFEACFYSYFWDTQSNLTLEESKKFGLRYNLYFKYLRALKMANAALNVTLGHTFSSDCRKKLSQISSCSLCAGMAAPYCSSYCSNVMRGCNVDLEELSHAYSIYNRSLYQAYSELLEYNPFGALKILQTRLIQFAISTSSSTTVIMNALTSRCGVTFPWNFGRKRRSASYSSAPLFAKRLSVAKRSLVAKRQSSSREDAALTASASCAAGVANMFTGLTGSLCSSGSSSCQCWNGTGGGSYIYTVPDPDRLSQRSNPELYIRPDTGLLYKDAISILMNVSKEMETCSSNVVSCDRQLCNIQLPTARNYDLAHGTNRYNLFQETGFFATPTTASVTQCEKVVTPTTDVAMTTTAGGTATSFHSTSSIQTLFSTPSPSSSSTLSSVTSTTTVPSPSSSRITSSSSSSSFSSPSSSSVRSPTESSLVNSVMTVSQSTSTSPTHYSTPLITSLHHSTSSFASFYSTPSTSSHYSTPSSSTPSTSTPSSSTPSTSTPSSSTPSTSTPSTSSRYSTPSFTRRPTTTPVVANPTGPDDDKSKSGGDSVTCSSLVVVLIVSLLGAYLL